MRSRRLRRATVPLLLVAVIVPYAVAGYALWQRTGADVAFAVAERDGLTLVRPIVKLISATADAQTAAVTGRATTEARAALQAAMSDVDAAENHAGDALANTKRWSDVRRELTTLLTDAPTGVAAYGGYAVATDLELTMLQAAGDSSNLILDPQLDSYYLMDTALLRLPHLLVDVGRYADLAVVGETGRTGARPAAATPDSQVAAALVADHVQSGLSAIDDALRKTFDATDSETVGPAVLGPLDRLRGAASVLVPRALGATTGGASGSSAAGTASSATVSSASAAGNVTTRSATDVQAARTRTRDAALALEQPAIAQLDLLVAARLDDLQNTRRWVAGTAAGGVLLTLVLAWARAARRQPEELTDPASAQPDDTPGPVPSGAGDGTAGGSPAADDEVLAEAQQMLDSGRLVRVGRAVAARRDDR
ncbi:MAG TPA: hypothetical protein VI248_08965 [Kineosporiaceae bacterium]